jgi:hypothetical protein
MSPTNGADALEREDEDAVSEAVEPPYTTTITPSVARTTAAKRRGSHFKLKRYTVIRYAKKAFVFHIAWEGQ